MVKSIVGACLVFLAITGSAQAVSVANPGETAFLQFSVFASNTLPSPTAGSVETLNNWTITASSQEFDGAFLGNPFQALGLTLGSGSLNDGFSLSVEFDRSALPAASTVAAPGVETGTLLLDIISTEASVNALAPGFSILEAFGSMTISASSFYEDPITATWSYSRLFADGFGQFGGGTFLVRVENTVSAVPLPAALPLFLASILGLGVIARSQSRKNQAA